MGLGKCVTIHTTLTAVYAALRFLKKIAGKYLQHNI